MCWSLCAAHVHILSNHIHLSFVSAKKGSFWDIKLSKNIVSPNLMVYHQFFISLAHSCHISGQAQFFQLLLVNCLKKCWSKSKSACTRDLLCSSPVAKALAVVNKYKLHPAILLWGFGNEKNFYASRQRVLEHSNSWRSWGTGNLVREWRFGFETHKEGARILIYWELGDHGMCFLAMATPCFGAPI